MTHYALLPEERLLLACAFKMLGTLYRKKPSDKALAPFFNLLKTAPLEKEWPLGDASQLQLIQKQLLQTDNDHQNPDIEKTLDLDWQRLFVGPNHLQAPPWGSVYLDKEQIIFGESTLALGTFLKQLGIRIDTGINEPEDHIGLMFWYIAGCIERSQDEALNLLLSEHTLPWAYRYLELLKIHAQAPFYEGLAALAQLSLQTLQELLNIQVKPKQLFF